MKSALFLSILLFFVSLSAANALHETDEVFGYHIYTGWNGLPGWALDELINDPGAFDASAPPSFPGSVNTASSDTCDLLGGDIGAFWWFDAESQEFVRVDESDDFGSSSGLGGEIIFFKSETNCEARSDSWLVTGDSDSGSFSVLDLERGWNFVDISFGWPVSFEQFFGECDVDRAYHLDAFGKEWDRVVVDDTERVGVIDFDSFDKENKVLAVRVATDCQTNPLAYDFTLDDGVITKLSVLGETSGGSDLVLANFSSVVLPATLSLFEYDSVGDLVDEVLIRDDGSINRVDGDIVYEYDSDDNLVKRTQTYTDGDVDVIDYDGDGNWVKRTYTYADGDVEVTVYEYDVDGNLVKETITRADGRVDVTVSEYDVDGNRVKETYTRADGEARVAVYEYDVDGNLVKETFTDADGDVSVRVWEYDVNGNRLKETYTDADGDADVYEYDVNGNRVKETITLFDGSVEVTVWEYDVNGNLVKETITRADGSVEVYDGNGDLIDEVRGNRVGSTNVSDLGSSCTESSQCRGGVCNNGVCGYKVRTIAGGGNTSVSTSNVSASNAELNVPQGVAVTNDGSKIFIADRNGHQILLLEGNVVRRIAGTGSAGAGGDSDVATSSALNNPAGVATNNDGSMVFVSDHVNHRVRLLEQKTDGNYNITTIAGNGSFGSSGEGVLATNARLNLPVGLAVHRDGRVFVADRNNTRIRSLTPQSNDSYIIDTVVSSGGDVVLGVALKSDTELIFSTSNQIFNSSTSAGSNRTLLVGSGLNTRGVIGIAVNSSGHILFNSRDGHTVRVLTPNNNVDRIAGNGNAGFDNEEVATATSFNRPQGIAVDNAGNVYIADTGNNRIRKLCIDANNC